MKLDRTPPVDTDEDTGANRSGDERLQFLANEGASSSNSGRELANVGGNSNLLSKEAAAGLQNFGNDDTPSTLGQLLSLQSLLTHFNNLQLRADFVNGRFGKSVNPEVLPLLDELRWSLFPSWKGGLLGGSDNPTMTTAMTHVEKLIGRSGDVAVTSSEEKEFLTYREWYQVLQAIATNKYWEETPLESRCSHGSTFLADRPEPKVESGNGRRVYAPEKGKSGGSVVRSKVEKPSSSSECSSSEDYEAKRSTSSEESDGSPNLYRGDKYYRRTRKRKDVREVVTPLPFDPNGQISLDKYLSSFETYFYNKFRGSDYDMSQQLGHFLTGDLKKIYDINGGRKLKYTKMKEKLMKYHSRHGKRGKSYWRRELAIAVPEGNEGLDLYGMRLQNIVELAFPRSSSTVHCSELYDHFMKTIPKNIAEKIRDTERTLKATSNGRKKKLSIDAISQMARDLQDEEPIQISVTWSDPVARSSLKSREGNHGSDAQPKSTLTGLMPMNEKKRSEVVAGQSEDLSYRRNSNAWKSRAQSCDRDRQSRNFNVPSRAKACFVCGRANHLAHQCWRRNNKCLICGDDHNMVECSRYIPNFKNSSRLGNAPGSSLGGES